MLLSSNVFDSGADQNLDSLDFLDCNVSQNWDSSSGDYVLLGIENNQCSLVETFASENVSQRYLKKTQLPCLTEIDG